MNKKIIISLGAAALLASSLLAMQPQSGMNQSDAPSCKQDKKMKGSKHDKRKGHNIVKMFMKLDLTDAQRTEIRTIMKNSRKNIANPNSAFTDASFDKAAYVKLVTQKESNKTQHKAEMIEDIYKVLTASQKKDFKTMLDMKELMKKNHKMRDSSQRER